MPSLLPNPSVVLFDMSNVIGGRPEVFIPDSGQILGIFTDPLFPQPGKFSINLPIEPTGAWLDVDHDGVKDQGIQIYSLKVGSNLFGNSRLQQMEQEAFVQSYLTDFVTGEITEGNFLLFAPDDRQDFPAAPGNDGVWFSGDEPNVTLPAGYSFATLPPHGPITLDRSPRLTVGILERAETESPDFSAQGILKSFHSLIDILGERYAYTDLRQLDWETIRAAYLPRVKKANAEDDMAAYYVLLHELAVSLGDTQVVATTKNLALSRALYQGAQKTATVGADVFAVWGEGDELPGARIQVLSVGEKSPAQKAGWVPGTEILSIDGEPIADRVAAVRLPVGIGTETVRLDGQARNVLNFEAGQEVTIEFRLPGSSDTQSATMTAGSYPQGGSTPPSAVRNPVSFRQIEDYGLVRWSDFLHYILPKLAVLEEALSVEQGRASGGIIIDLRGNSGGWVALYETMASYLFTAENPMPVGIFDEYFFDASQGKRVKVYSPDYKISAPNPDHAHSGPVVVLVDQTSASAAEYFSQHLQQLKRATIIGQYPTSGAGGECGAGHHACRNLISIHSGLNFLRWHPHAKPRSQRCQTRCSSSCHPQDGARQDPGRGSAVRCGDRLPG
jgi:carboxyl-terminal processing protease